MTMSMRGLKAKSRSVVHGAVELSVLKFTPKRWLRLFVRGIGNKSLKMNKKFWLLRLFKKTGWTSKKVFSVVTTIWGIPQKNGFFICCGWLELVKKPLNMRNS